MYRPFNQYVISAREPIEGEKYSPFLDYNKMKALGSDVCYAFNAKGEPWLLWENPMYLVHQIGYPVPEGYKPLFPVGSNPGLTQFIERQYEEMYASKEKMGASSRCTMQDPSNGIMPTTTTPATTVSRYVSDVSSTTCGVHKQVSQNPPAKYKEAVEVEKKKVDPAYAITQTLLEKVSIKILGEAIYWYDKTHYRHISGENLSRLIMRYCRGEIEREGNGRLVDAIFRLILCEPEIADETEDVDENLLSFMNGVLDISGHRLYKHDPKYNTYYCLNTNYIQGSDHPVFDRFVMEITGGDPELQQRILEVIGYCLVPDTHGKCYFVFQGVSDSGKSLLASFVRECLKPENCVSIDILGLGERFSKSTLIGKQLCLAMDIPSSPLSAKTVSEFKGLTGGDLITADVKYRPHVTFLNRAKFILGTNHPLLTQNDDPAFYRRAIVIPFVNSIPKERQDTNLLKKLTAERGAIVRDSLMAYYRLRDNNYRFTGDYRINQIFGTTDCPASISFDETLETFLQGNYEPMDDAILFTEDIFQHFEREHPGLISYLQFSKKLLECCNRIGWTKVERTTKGRREGEKATIARMRGIALRKSNLVKPEFDVHCVPNHE